MTEADDVPGAHAHAAPGGGAAEAFLCRGTMDVDAAFQGVGVLGLFATEAQDARDDGIAAGSVCAQDFSCGFASAKVSTFGQAFADDVDDFQMAEGSLVGTELVPEAKLGGADGIALLWDVVFKGHHHLLLDTDDDALLRRRLRTAAARREDGEP